MEQMIKSLMDKRASTWESAKKLLDECDTAQRSMSAEEEQTWQRHNEELTELDKRIGELTELDKANRAAEATRAEFDGIARPQPGAEERNDEGTQLEQEIRAFLRGERRDVGITPEKPMGSAEFRTLSRLTAAAGNNTVKTGFYEQLMAHLIEVSGILQAGPTVLQTDNGESLQIPKTTAHGSAALTAEAAAIAAGDPTFGQVTLGAFKYAVLIQLSRELIDDTTVDLLGYLAMQAGRAVGNAFGVHLITGTGAGAQPSGIVPGSTVGVTGGAGVAGAFTADNLIDLYFSVIAPYRSSPSCSWLMRDATLASVRKLKDTTNQYLWQPSMQVGAPDTLLGKPVHTDPNVAAVATSARSVLFGDLSAYFVRMVGALRFERSDDFAFSSDLVTFKAVLRGDGVLVDQTGAVKHFIGNAA